jgi:threonine synthase
MAGERSAATGQHALGRPDESFPLEPPLTAGVARDGDAGPEPRPLEVGYDYDAVDPGSLPDGATPGIGRWAPLLPPLSGEGLAAGGTPLVEAPALAEWADVDAAVYVKDESRNPTWSHKDRLNRVTTGAALRAGAAGVVAASTGNHGASAAAHAARNDLPCVVFTTPGTPPAMEEFVRTYGAAVVRLTDHDGLVDLVDAFARRGFHPVTSRTDPHTGHPWGPEGYKTIAYETHAQLGTVPGTVFVPTAFAELLYGVWKGFRELRRLGIADATPRMVACEPAPQAALVAARERGDPVVEVEAGPSGAHSIGGSRSTHRGYRALEASDGVAVPVPEATIGAAQRRLSRRGLWQEYSAAAGAGGLAAIDDGVDGPAVVLGCSSGYKDGTDWTAPEVEPSVAAATDVLENAYDLAVPPGDD